INGQWKKITTNPLLYKQYKISESEYRKDKDLLSYAEMASEEKNLKGIAFIACLLKSFKSNVFSKYLGIYYEDTAVVSGEIYQYKISQIINAREVECALSKEIEAGK